MGGIDYATAPLREAWLRHPVLGDPSFDAFQRGAANPICRGAPPLEWPVNGFLFLDPVSGHRYAYVGHYAAGYAIGPGKESRCTVYRSTDDGRSWEHVGPIFADEDFFEIPANIAAKRVRILVGQVFVQRMLILALYGYFRKHGKCHAVIHRAKSCNFFV